MKKIGYFLVFLCLLLVSAGCSSTSSTESKADPATSDKKTEITISAAASLTDALNDLKASFEKEHPNTLLTFNFGGSGKLAQQIEQGAPADVFLSASKQDMDELEKKDLIKKDSRTNFAENKLVLITNKKHSIQLASFKELNSEKVEHLAIGEPESVPAGQYTKETLEHLKLWEPLQNKLVLASDVRQVLAYVESGNADAGVVYSSDALISDQVNVLAEANTDWHEPIIYPGAIVKASKHTEDAQLFLNYLTSEKGKNTLNKYGFK